MTLCVAVTCAGAAAAAAAVTTTSAWADATVRLTHTHHTQHTHHVFDFQIPSQPNSQAPRCGVHFLVAPPHTHPATVLVPRRLPSPHLLPSPPCFLVFSPHSHVQPTHPYPCSPQGAGHGGVEEEDDEFDAAAIDWRQVFCLSGALHALVELRTHRVVAASKAWEASAGEGAHTRRGGGGGGGVHSQRRRGGAEAPHRVTYHTTHRRTCPPLTQA